MTTRDKAEALMYKLYRMWHKFEYMSVDKMLTLATPEEIDYYYYFIVERCKHDN